ncbi:hypothetical protein MMOR_09780 [Mycolicibacterium moriokaense]|uniref:Uncharacterized protein n=1 Tax=Mycolicibacterium moriokaense TaxID=39691 RepID=A0AAD1H7L0_9MYCO|nr:hypothetical protein MMOR_09780 [Mycolicibacterium moriokaense]
MVPPSITFAWSLWIRHGVCEGAAALQLPCRPPEPWPAGKCRFLRPPLVPSALKAARTLVAGRISSAAVIESKAFDSCDSRHYSAHSETARLLNIDVSNMGGLVVKTSTQTA